MNEKISNSSCALEFRKISLTMQSLERNDKDHTNAINEIRSKLNGLLYTAIAIFLQIGAIFIMGGFNV